MYEFAVVGSNIDGSSTAIRLSKHGHVVIIFRDKKSASTVCAGTITLQHEILRAS